MPSSPPSFRAITRPLALAIAVLFVVTALGPGVADASASALTLTAAENPVTVPDNIRLNASADFTVGPHARIDVWEIRSNGQWWPVGECSGSSSCNVNVLTGWSTQYSPAPREFVAEVLTDSNVMLAESPHLTVDVRRFEFTISLSGSEHVVVPDQIHLHPRASRDLSGSPYQIGIVEGNTADTGRYIGECDAGATTCDIPVDDSWGYQASPQPRKFFAEITGGGATSAAGPSDPFTVDVQAHIWTVDLTESNRQTDSQGNVSYDLTAHTERDTGPWSLVIENSQHQTITSCQATDSCLAQHVAAGRYRAYAFDSSGRYGASAYEGFDLTQLAALFASSADVCTEVAMIPGLSFNSSLNEASQACFAAQAAGVPLRTVLARTIAVGGATVAAWLAYLSSINYDPQHPTVPPPPPTAPPPVYHPAPSAAVPQVWDGAITELADALKAKNSAATLSDVAARAVARECLLYLAAAAYGPSECKQVPVFVWGNNAREPAQHDIEALLGSGTEPGQPQIPHPEWVKLNYRPLSESPWTSRWKNSYQPCSSATPPGEACDEYPFLSTRQGGDITPRPSLKYVDFGQNSSQGGSLGNYYSSCAMGSGDAFLSVPLPAELANPPAGPPLNSFALCNR